MKPCCIIGFLLSGGAGVPLAPSGGPPQLRGSVLHCRRNDLDKECSGTVGDSSALQTILLFSWNAKHTGTYKKALRTGTRRHISRFLREATGPVVLCSSLQVVARSQISPDRIPTLVILSRQYG